MRSAEWTESGPGNPLPVNRTSRVISSVGDLGMYLGVIVNPFARKNRGASDDRCAGLRRLVGPWGEVHETDSVRDLPGIVERLRPRASHLVSDGGDGALHWLINEMLVQESDRGGGRHSYPPTADPSTSSPARRECAGGPTRFCKPSARPRRRTDDRRKSGWTPSNYAVKPVTAQRFIELVSRWRPAASATGSSTSTTSTSIPAA